MSEILENSDNGEGTCQAKFWAVNPGDAPIPFAAAPARPAKPAKPAHPSVLRAGDPALNPDAPRKCAPVVTKDGVPAYELRYPAGVRGGGNMNCTFAPKGVFPCEQVRLGFRVMPERGFPWGGGRQKAGGKLLGFKMGTGDSQGGAYSATGASYRLTWSYAGGVAPYVYPAVRGGGQPKNLKALDQLPAFEKVASLSKGVHLWHPRDREDPASWDLRLREGQWNDVEMFVKLNAPGKHDGALEMTVNGVTKKLEGVRWRYSDATKINGVLVHSFFGGGDQSYAPPTATRTWLADFRFANA